MIWLTIYHFYSIVFVYFAYLLIHINIKMSKANKQHQWLIIILMMLQHKPCKQTLLCHVAVESNLYFSYAIVLLHCIYTVMTREVFRPFILVNSYDHHCFSYVLFVIKIIRLPLSALLWYMQILVQNGLMQWAQ